MRQKFRLIATEYASFARLRTFYPNRERRTAALQLEHDYRAPEMDLVAGLQARAARVAVHFAAQAVAHDPGAALGAALIPAVVEETVLAGGAVVADVGMLARDGAIDLGILHEGEIVAAVEALVAVDVDLAADVGARLGEPKLGDVRSACAHDQPGDSRGGVRALRRGFDVQPSLAGLRQTGGDGDLDAQRGVDFLLEVLAEEAAAEELGARFFNAAQRHADQIEREDLTRAGAVALAADFVERGKPDLGELGRRGVVRGE